MPHRLTVRQDLAVFADLHNVADAARVIIRLAEDLLLGDFLERQTGKLSAGRKTRVALAKTLVNGCSRR